MLHGNRAWSMAAIFWMAAGAIHADSSEAVKSQNWPQWRGADLTGAALESDTPAEWSDGKNIRWKVALPGKGHATPIIWEKKVFVLAAVSTDGAGENRALNFDVLCVDRQTGKTIWQKTAKTAKAHEGYHRQYGSFASGSPVTDGKHVWAFFGSRGLYCYDLDGNRVWERDFGVQMRMRNGFGEGTSPALHGDTLVMHFDDESQNSFIVAVDKNTGKDIWRAKRDEGSSWSTPRIVTVGGRTEVILPASNLTRSYDLKTGELIWQCAGLGSNVIPTAQIAHGNVIVMSGHRNPALFAVELGRKGDLTGTDAIKWRLARGMPYTPSPLLHGDLMYLIVERGGMVTCVDTKTGQAHYVTERLPGTYSFKASPTGSKDKIYLATEQGDVVVLKAGPKFEILATNKHDEFFIASPVIVGNELFLRGDRHLYCVAAD